MLKQATLSLKESLLGLSPVEDEDEGEPPTPSQPPAPSSLALHRAAFAAADDALRSLLTGAAPEALAARDPQGNTALHVAVLRHSLGAVRALLAAGASPEAQNARKWTPLDEAIALKDREAVKLLLERLRLEGKLARKARKPRLLAAMRAMPDFRMQLRWELGSPLFGLLLRRYAPSDTYTLHKAGLRLRVDGELRGLDPRSRSVLPRWKRGPFSGPVLLRSLLVDAGTSPVTAFLLDHTDRTFYDLYQERKAALRDPDADAEELVAAGAGRVRLRAGALDFRPARSWLGRPVVAQVEGYCAEVFEMAGRLVAVVLRKAAFRLPASCTFEQYLATPQPPDEREEVPWDPLQAPPPTVAATFAADAEASAELDAARGGGGGGAGRRGREVKARFWMARAFPITLRQLLPLMEAVGGANKHIAAAAQFVGQYRDHALFPIRMTVPLMWTVSLLLRFRGYRELRPRGGAHVAAAPGFFDVPAGYRRVQLAEAALEGAEGETFYDAREE